MEKIIGVNGKNPIDYFTGKPDMSRKKLEYKGIIFLQLASNGKPKYQ